MMTAFAVSALSVTAQTQRSASRPVVVAVLVDFTGSVAEWGVEPVTTETLNPLFDLISERGGEIAVGAIIEDHSSFLKRLRLAPPSPELEPPDTNTDVFTRRKRLREWKKRLAGLEAIERKRRAENRVKIDAFIVGLDSLLSTKPDRPATDLWGAVARVAGYMSEDPFYWVSTSGQKPSRHILIVSDGRNTVASSPDVRIPSDITIAVVSGVAGLGDLGDLGRRRVKWFENPSAAVFYIISIVLEGS